MTYKDAENFQQIWNRLWGARFTEKQAERLKREIDLRVEKVEVFKPGDRLRHKEAGFEITLAEDGFIHHTLQTYHKVSDTFTSEKYERVYPA